MNKYTLRNIFRNWPDRIAWGLAAAYNTLPAACFPLFNSELSLSIDLQFPNPKVLGSDAPLQVRINELARKIPMTPPTLYLSPLPLLVSPTVAGRALYITQGFLDFFYKSGMDPLLLIAHELKHARDRDNERKGFLRFWSFLFTKKFMRNRLIPALSYQMELGGDEMAARHVSAKKLAKALYKISIALHKDPSSREGQPISLYSYLRREAPTHPSTALRIHRLMRQHSAQPLND
jgi:hypothetical protein